MCCVFDQPPGHNMLYRPKLSNGKRVSLSWPIAMFRCINTICWPLEDGVSIFVSFIDRLYYVGAFVLSMQIGEAELRYLRYNYQNLDQMLIGMPTYVVLLETQFRAFHLGWYKTQFKQIMQRFYRQIYIDKATNPHRLARIQRQLRPTVIYSSSYFAVLLLFMATPIYNLIHDQRDMLYKSIYPFDHTPLHIYVPLVLSQIWVGFIVVTLLFGEANILANVVLHLNGRYLLLHEDLEARTHALLQESTAHADSIAKKFQYILIDIIERNVKLNEFAAEFKRFYSYRIFILFALTAALLCALGFKVYTNPSDSLTYAIWICSKTAETLVFGAVGSTIIDTTDKLSSMYYLCNWELIILRSTNTRENIRLMKLVAIAIETNQRPFVLNGLNYFSVSLASVVKILQGAASYFTCLISLR